jgi:hypothetical protein
MYGHFGASEHDIGFLGLFASRKDRGGLISELLLEDHDVLKPLFGSNMLVSG